MTTSGAYDALVGLHVASAVVGFGAVAISGAYGAIGRRSGSKDETARYFAYPGRAEYLILAVAVFGVAAMSVRPDGSEFGSAWAISGLAIWVLASGLLLGVVRPAERSIRASPDTPGRAATRLMWAAGVCDLLFVAALMLMVTQP